MRFAPALAAWVISLAAALVLGGCCSETIWGKQPQPVVLFYVERKDENDARLQIIARRLATKYDMRYEDIKKPEKEFDSGRLFEATRNSWFYYQCLASADDAEFSGQYYDEHRIDLIVVGPTNHEVVHGLVVDWTAALDSAGIEYRKEVRQPLQPIVDR